MTLWCATCLYIAKAGTELLPTAEAVTFVGGDALCGTHARSALRARR
jgi:hypothetical protein